LRGGVPSSIEIIERDADIENAEFAAEAANKLIMLMAARKIDKEERNGGALLANRVSRSFARGD
jgi:hypothetical protein